MKFTLMFCFVCIINLVIAQEPRLIMPMGHTDHVNTARFSLTI